MLVVKVLLVPLTVMPLVRGVQAIGGARLAVQFKTKALSLVGQERMMFGGLAARLNATAELSTWIVTFAGL